MTKTGERRKKEQIHKVLGKVTYDNLNNSGIFDDDHEDFISSMIFINTQLETTAELL